MQQSWCPEASGVTRKTCRNPRSGEPRPAARDSCQHPLGAKGAERHLVGGGRLCNLLSGLSWRGRAAQAGAGEWSLKERTGGWKGPGMLVEQEGEGSGMGPVDPRLTGATV